MYERGLKMLLEKNNEKRFSLSLSRALLITSTFIISKAITLCEDLVAAIREKKKK
jgi:hypothetical protein